MEEVSKVVAEFDKDQNGTLGFGEFLHMLTRRPWKQLLPLDVQDKLPKAVMMLSRAAVAAALDNTTIVTLVLTLRGT